MIHKDGDAIGVHDAAEARRFRPFPDSTPEGVGCRNCDDETLSPGQSRT